MAMPMALTFIIQEDGIPLMDFSKGPRPPCTPPPAQQTTLILYTVFLGLYLSSSLFYTDIHYAVL